MRHILCCASQEAWPSEEALSDLCMSPDSELAGGCHGHRHELEQLQELLKFTAAIPGLLTGWHHSPESQNYGNPPSHPQTCLLQIGTARGQSRDDPTLRNSPWTTTVPLWYNM